MARRVRDWVGFRQPIPSTLRRAPTHIRPPSIRASLARLLFLLPVLTRPALAQEPAAVKDQMRVTLGITRPLGANTLGVSALGVFSNPNKDVHSLYVSPLSVVHKPGKWCELWLGLFC